MKPNIFDIATKELSQDAFITWLILWADDSCKNIDGCLHQCAKSFVGELIKKQIPDFSELIHTVKAGRQWENIDIWAEINNKYLIIIEDKVYSSHHSNQLKRYRETAEKWCLENKYEMPICIYLKIGNEALNSLKYVEKQGFSVFNRRDILSVILPFSNIKNDIFIDFKERLDRIEQKNSFFIDKIIGEWNGSDWQGFFQFLEHEIDIINWGYVNNPNGGFWHAVLNWDYWNIYPVYIQIEERKLCFKVSTDPEEVGALKDKNRGQIRNELYQIAISKAKEYNVSYIKKPERFGNGNYMTFAIVNCENWLGTSTDKINIKETLNALKMYRTFVQDKIINGS